MSVIRRAVTLVSLLTVAFAGALVAASPASAAGSVVLSGSTITYTGTASVDRITLDTNSRECGNVGCVRITASDALAGVTGCSMTANRLTAFCISGSTPFEVRINLGAGNDFYTTSVTHLDATRLGAVIVDAGDGNDTLTGGGARETLVGGPGNDLLIPDAGPNSFNIKNDTVSGGPGIDTVDYRPSFGAASGVKITLDGAANDGTTTPGDTDNVFSDNEIFYLTAANDTFVGNVQTPLVNTVYGLAGNDRLTGGVGNETLVGGPGNDSVNGGVGNDTINGEDGDDLLVGGVGNDSVNGGVGNDTINGEVGDDILVGGVGNDRVDGGVGNDTINGDDGGDILFGGTGNDTLEGGPGYDFVFGDTPNDPNASGDDLLKLQDGAADEATCGPGNDRAEADTSDIFNDNCESIVIGGQTPPTLTADLALANKRLNANKKRKRAHIRITCTGGLPCTGRITVKTVGKSRKVLGKKRLAKGTYSLTANTKTRARVKLNRNARKLLRRTKRAAVRITFTATDTRSKLIKRARLVR